MERFREVNSLPRNKAKAYLKSLFDPDPSIGIITGALKAGEKVTIYNFGTFELRIRKAMKGRNLWTGETIHVK